MGCDIHAYVERKRPDGTWEAVSGVRVDPYMKEHYGPDRPEVDYRLDFGRSYNSFARLADVRNYNSITPLAAPRGLPDDLGEYLRTPETVNGGPWLGDHSFSWFLLSELRDAAVAVEETGVISLQQFRDLWDGKDPEEWCKMTAGSRRVTIADTDKDARTLGWPKNMSSVIREGEKLEEIGLEVFVQTTWHRDDGTAELREVVKALSDYAEANGIKDEDLRLVFGFDS